MEHALNLMVINAQNKIGNQEEYFKHDVMEMGSISNNPYPVFYIDKKPIYEGDYVIEAFDTVSLRQVNWLMRTLLQQNGTVYIRNKFLNIQKAEHYIKHLQNDTDKA